MGPERITSKKPPASNGHHEPWNEPYRPAASIAFFRLRSSRPPQRLYRPIRLNCSKTLIFSSFSIWPILTKQVFGIGITRITSLLARRSVYCSKYANGNHSIAKSFATEDGNIWFRSTKHSWTGEKCSYCGAAKSVFDRSEGLETDSYAFLHTDNIKTRITKIFGEKMQFDVIIGNSPYPLSDDSFGTSVAPSYQLFVQQA